MPEPVVIIGPAAGPAGPISEQAGVMADSEAAEASDHAEDTNASARAAKNKGAPLAAFSGILRFGAALALRVARAVASVILAVVRRYPRHSIAAVASILILGGIVYSQSRSGTTRRDVTNAISGNRSPDEAGAKETQSGPGTQVADGAKAGEGTEKEKGGAFELVGPPKPEKTDTTVAQNEPAKPAPQPQSLEHDTPTLPALAQGEQRRNDEQKIEAAPAPAGAPAILSPDHVEVPLPAPAAVTAAAGATDAAKATLLSSSPSPGHGDTPPAPVSSLANEKKNAEPVTVSSPKDEKPVPAPPATSTAGGGEQVAKASPTPEPPADLWLPDSAAKAGEEKPKESKAGESGLSPAPAPAPTPTQPISMPETLAPASSESPAQVQAAAPSGEGKPHDEAKKVDAPATPVIESASKPPVEPAPVPDGTTERPVVNSQKSNAPDPAPPPASAAPGRAEVPATATEPVRQAPAADKITMPAGEPTESRPTEPTAASRKPSGEGWVPIANSGSPPVDPTEKAGGPGAGEPERGSGLSSPADSRFHARRSIDFEPEPGQLEQNNAAANRSPGGARSAVTPGADREPRAASHTERVEATEHVVERGENYWTIARQYWGSGRYFAALWKANAANHPAIDVLREGDIIVVPAIEELNPDYILPPGRTATPEWEARLGIARRASRAPKTSGAIADADLSGATGRTRPASGSGKVPARRASRPEYEDDGPPSMPASGDDRSTAYKGRSAAAAKRFDGDDAGDDQDVRTTARPRGSAGGTSRAIYRVRPNDTLRKIARDKLGDSRRAGEILDLNRDVIDDPSQLVAGQVLELPEDAGNGVRARQGGR